MKPTGIVTLHQSTNFGAFLQAFALQEYLRQQGLDPVFVDIDYRLALHKRMRRRIGQLVGRKWFAQQQAAILANSVASHFDTGGRASDDYAQLFVGSDEMWTVRNPSFRSRKQFFGVGLRAERLSAYAPSMGQTRFEDLAGQPALVQGLKAFDDLSARDAATVDAVQRLTGREVAHVLDPTFLIDWQPHIKQTQVKDALLVYSYAVGGAALESLREYATSHGLRLVATGMSHDWADELVPATPFEFLGLLQSARAVVTDTFHGTIFAALMGANFAVLGHNPRNKLKALIDELGLHARVWNGQRSLPHALTGPFAFPRQEDPYASRERASMAYLRSCLFGDVVSAPTSRAESRAGGSYADVEA